MKISKKRLTAQRQQVDVKVRALLALRGVVPPRSGWLKAVRESLGLSARQLGERLRITPQVITRMEQREEVGKVTLETLQRAARAMGCRLVYAIVPEGSFESLDDIVTKRSLALATRLAAGVSRSMSLENQSVETERTSEHVRELAQELKARLDPRIWNEPE
ncbi:MAG: mobile mystery protein A [Myxococcaceae bacterium]